MAQGWVEGPWGNALIPGPCGGVVFETWVKSPEDRTVGCWIDCLKVNGEYGRDGVVRMPRRGEWSAEGTSECPREVVDFEYSATPGGLRP